MRTGDGFLARLPPLAAPLAPAQLAAIAAAAARHGNGLVEISKRGNLQIRGLASPDTAELAADLAAAGLLLTEGVPIGSDPLAVAAGARDPAPIVAELHRLLAETGIGPRLAPKVALLLDLGTATAPAGVVADLRLAWRGPQVHIGLGGTHATAKWIGAVPEQAAVATAMAILAALADHGAEARLAGPAGVGDDPRLVSAAGRLFPGRPSAPANPAVPVGPVAGLGQAAHGIAFPFGQADAAALGALAGSAERAGLAALAPAPERALLLAGDAAAIADTVATAARLGFITDARDPRRFIAACIGSAGCAAGHFPARALARDAAVALGPLLDGSLSFHFSGCGKGCAHPDPADVTLSGIDKGASLVLDGRARDRPVGFDAPERLVERLAGLADRVSGSGATARMAIERIGWAGVAGAMAGEASGEHGGEPTLSA